jgi:hypothetical protein
MQDHMTHRVSGHVITWTFSMDFPRRKGFFSLAGTSPFCQADVFLALLFGLWSLTKNFDGSIFRRLGIQNRVLKLVSQPDAAHHITSEDTKTAGRPESMPYYPIPDDIRELFDQLKRVAC